MPPGSSIPSIIHILTPGMKQSLRKLIVALAFLIAAMIDVLCAFGEARTPGLSNLMMQKSEDLIQEGENLITRDTLHERAFDCFTIVVSRYNENPSSPEARRNATIALRKLGNLSMSYMIDYRNAYHDLMTARQLAEEDNNHYQLASIFSSLANLYSFNSANNPELRKEGMDYLRRACEEALISHNEDVLISVGTNFAVYSIMGDNIKPYDTVMKKIINYRFNGHPGKPLFAKTLIKAAYAYSGNRPESAIEMLKTALDIANKIEAISYNERNRYVVGFCLVQIYDKISKPDLAIQVAIDNLKHADTKHHDDFSITYLGILQNLYSIVGKTDSAEFCHTEYLKREEILKSKKGYQTLEFLDLKSKLNNLNSQLTSMSEIHERENHHRLIMISILSIVSLFLLFLLFWRRMSSARGKLPQDKTENINFEANISYTKPDRAEVIGDEERAALGRLFERICKIMEESDEICKPGFGLNDLAKLVSAPSRNISKSIKILHDSNFPQMLGEYRVKRVVELMGDPESKNLTVQSISESVGFRSRTNFAVIFKKNMGMTPSEYWSTLHLAEKSQF